MYVGSTTLFLSRAVLTGSPAGLVLTAWVWLVYRVGCWFEEPFTSFIYEQAALRQELAAQEVLKIYIIF
jgi:phosphatidylethanolamine N-methyltransferase